MIEDVTTSGKSMEETVPKVKGAANVEIVGLMVSLNRMEKGLNSDKCALDEIKETYGFPTAAIVDMSDVVEHLYNKPYKGEVYIDYLVKKEGIEPEQGNFVDEAGNVLGTHQGIIYYTVGQRKGLGIAFGEPRYVKELRPETNEVVLSGNDALQSRIVYAREYHGMALEQIEDGMRLLAKIRYSHKGAMCTVNCEGERLRLEFDEPQRAATPGQAVVFYKEEEIVDGTKVLVVAGGAVICRELV